MRAAYKCTKVESAEQLLNNLARTPKKYPSAAASLRKGLDETLTVMGLGPLATRTRSFSTTNPIENMNGSIRRMMRRVKRWNDGTIILRWVLVGVLEATRDFRRLEGHVDVQEARRCSRKSTARPSPETTETLRAPAR
jgi:transposase-like protein